MAKAKTKKEQVIDLKPKAEKITADQLKEVQSVIAQINRGQMEIGKLEVNKLGVLNMLTNLNEALMTLQNTFEKDYGTVDINIQDGTINYGEAN